MLNHYTEQPAHDVAGTQQTIVAWEASGVKDQNAVREHPDTKLEEASPWLTPLQQQLAQESRPVLSLSEMGASTHSKWAAL